MDLHSGDKRKASVPNDEIRYETKVERQNDLKTGEQVDIKYITNAYNSSNEEIG